MRTRQQPSNIMSEMQPPKSLFVVIERGPHAPCGYVYSSHLYRDEADEMAMDLRSDYLCGYECCVVEYSLGPVLRADGDGIGASIALPLNNNVSGHFQSPKAAAVSAVPPAHHPTPRAVLAASEHFPHTCPSCGKPAYVGLSRTSCSNKGCAHYAPEDKAHTKDTEPLDGEITWPMWHKLLEGLVSYVTLVGNSVHFVVNSDGAACVTLIPYPSDTATYRFIGLDPAFAEWHDGSGVFSASGIPMRLRSLEKEFYEKLKVFLDGN